MRLFFLKILILLSFPLFLFGATVIKKNGSVIKGDIVDQDESDLKLRLPSNQVISIPKSDLLKVSYQDLSESESTEIIQKAKNAENQAQNTNRQDSRANDEQITKLSETVDSLSKQLEEQKTRIQELESFKKTMDARFPNEGPKKVQWAVVWRSMILPGWGQIHWNEPYWGSFYGLAFVGAAANYNEKWNEFQKVEKSYKNNLPEFLLASNGLGALTAIPPVNERSEWKSKAQESNEAIQILAGVYLLNVIDAFWKRPEREKALADRSGLNFSVLPDFGISPKTGDWGTGVSTYIQYRGILE